MPRVRRRHVEPQTLCAEDAAHYCGMGVKTFRAEVQAGTGPRPWNPRLHRDPDARVMLRYAVGDLDEWIAARSLDPSVSAKFAVVPASPPAVERRLPGQGHAPLAGHDSQAGAA